MSLQLWLLYCATVFVVSATPGPNMLHILQRSVTLGLGRSLPAMLGCMTGLLILMSASIMGLTAVLLALPGAFDVLRYLGTAYLVYLGIKAWRAPVEPAGDEDAPAGPVDLSPLTVFRGGVLIENAAYVTATNCTFDNDVPVDGATSIGAVAIGQSSSKVVLRDCSYKGRVSGDSSYSYGVISVAPYRLAGTLSGATHAALSPSDVTIDGGFVKATEGVAGVYIEGCGSTAAISGTTSSYTPPTNSPSNTSGILVFSGTPFSGKVDWFIGRRVIETSTGYQANVVANSSNTLYLAPVAENYTAGLAWFDRNGLPASDPSFASAKTVTILPAQGEISIRNLRIDCARTDDSAAGGNGILFDTSSTFDTGYDDMRIDLDNNRIHGATGAGIKVWLRGPAASGSQLRLVDNVTSDDQATATTTYGIELVGADGWGGVEMHGNRTRNSITLVTGDEDIPYYLSSPDYPPTYTGNASPEGVLAAPYQSQFVYPGGNVTYRKHTSDSFNTGWTVVRTAARPEFRAAGTMTAGVQSGSLTPTLATAFVGDIE